MRQAVVDREITRRVEDPELGVDVTFPLVYTLTLTSTPTISNMSSKYNKTVLALKVLQKVLMSIWRPFNAMLSLQAQYTLRCLTIFRTTDYLLSWRTSANGV